MAALYMNQRRNKEKTSVMTSKEDIRDNVIHYDDEGGGEADTRAFDIDALRSSSSRSSTSKVERNSYGDGVLLHLTSRCNNVRSPDIHRQTASVIIGVNKSCHDRKTERGTGIIREFIRQRLEESQLECAAPSYDSLATYAYEGDGSGAGSLSSIEESWVIDSSGDLSSPSEWGQTIKTLAINVERQPPTL